MAPRIVPLRPPVGQPLTIAHRGASHVAPENTLSALRSALAAGADMVEVDVRRTADGELVLMHDPTLARTTDVEVRYPTRAPWRVHQFTLAELRTLDAGSWKSSSFCDEQVATLDEALAVIERAGSRLLLEVKQPAAYPGIERDVASLLRRRRRGRSVRADEVVVQSFDREAMHRFAWEAPEVPTGVLSVVPRSEVPALAGWASYVNPHHSRADRRYVDALHEAGLRCFAWTVDGPRAVRRLLRAGVDGVISNRPEVVREVRAATAGAQPAD